MVSLYFVYRPKKNASRTNITNDDQNAYEFAPTYGDGYTAFHRHMISVIVFFKSITLKIMLVDYAVTEMGRFDEYLDAAPHAKIMKGNGIATFLLHITQYITLINKKLLQQHLLPRHC